MDYSKIFERLSTLPALVYSEKILERNFQNIVDGFSKHTSLSWRCFYAMKSCYNPDLIQRLSDLGAGIECMGELEYSIALKLRIKTENILLNGIGKSSSLLMKAVKNSSIIFIETKTELEHIKTISKNISHNIKIGLRVLPDLRKFKESPYSKFDIKMGHRPHDNLFNEILDTVSNNSNIILEVLHCHGTINSKNSSIHLEIISQLAEIVKNIEENYIFNIPIINIGGGIGTFKLDKNDNAIDYFSCLGEKFQKTFSNKTIAIEPGRYLSNNCGLFFGSIIDYKKQGDTHFYFTDIGTNTLIPIPTATYYLLYPNQININQDAVLSDGITSPDNIILRASNFPKLKLNDKIILGNCGAYTSVYSHNWCYAKPAIYWLDNHDQLKQSKDIAAEITRACPHFIATS